MPTRDDYEFAHIAAGATTVVIGAACKLIRVTVNTTAAGAITVYNSPTSLAASSSNAVAVLKSNVVEGPYDYFVKCASGLTVVTAAASDITVVYATA